MGHARTSRFCGLHFCCDAEHAIERVHKQNPNESGERRCKRQDDQHPDVLEKKDAHESNLQPICQFGDDEALREECEHTFSDGVRQREDDEAEANHLTMIVK